MVPSRRRIAEDARGNQRQFQDSFISWSELGNAMTSQQHERWRKAAGGLKARLDTDHRNQRMLCDPWSRAAHCMVQGWRNIVSQGRLGYVPRPRRRISTWQEAAASMKVSLASRKQSRLLDTTTWQFWANHLPRVKLRYIPKAKRNLAAQLDV
jgi:hypothetical protein